MEGKQIQFVYINNTHTDYGDFHSITYWYIFAVKALRLIPSPCWCFAQRAQIFLGWKKVLHVCDSPAPHAPMYTMLSGKSEIAYTQSSKKLMMYWEGQLRGKMWMRLKQSVQNAITKKHFSCKFKLALLMSQWLRFTSVVALRVVIDGVIEILWLLKNLRFSCFVISKMEAQDKSNRTFDMLPDELVIHIMSYLDEDTRFWILGFVEFVY